MKSTKPKGNPRKPGKGQGSRQSEAAPTPKTCCKPKKKGR